MQCFCREDSEENLGKGIYALTERHICEKELLTDTLFECRTAYLKPLFSSCKFPWQIVAQINGYLQKMLNEGIDGFSVYAQEIIVGRNVNISPSAHIIPPAIIGDECDIRVGAYIRGNVILGKGVVVGNSSELKNCILLDGAQAPHYNYVGDSILGNRAHLGAGAICSNLKSDGNDVSIRAEGEYRTGMRKLGAILGDGVEVGCGSVLNPGTVVGKHTRVYPLTSLRGVVPSDCIVKSNTEIVAITR